MAWNREKFIRELDRKRLPKGVQAAAHDRPQAAMDHVMDVLRSSKATENQIANALQLASDISRLKAVTVSASELFSTTCGYLSHDSERVRESAGRSAIHQMLRGLVCPSQRLPVKLAQEALPAVQAASSMPTGIIDYIKELMASVGEASGDASKLEQITRDLAMDDHASARQMVQEYLGSREAGETRLVVLESETVESGWVFYCNSEEYANGDEDAWLIGEPPIFVDKRTRCMYCLGTGQPVEVYLRQVEEGNGCLIQWPPTQGKA